MKGKNMNEISGNKLGFANEIMELSDTSYLANDCERYGMAWGCDMDCPVFRNHKCEQRFDENKQMYKDYLQELTANGYDITQHIL